MRNKFGKRVPASGPLSEDINRDLVISRSAKADSASVSRELSRDDVQSDLQVSRFRPNLLLRRGPILKSTQSLSISDLNGEDYWRSIRLSINSETGENEPVTLEVTGPCSRCQMININQTSGVIDGRYLQALAEYRKVGSRVNFGHFLRMSTELADKVNCLVQEVDVDSSHDSYDSFWGKAPPVYLFEGMLCEVTI